MKKSIILVAAVILMMTGCGDRFSDMSNSTDSSRNEAQSGNSTNSTENSDGGVQIKELESGFSYAEFKGDYAFDKFLSGGGAESDTEVISFLTKNLIGDAISEFGGENFGCSAFSAKSENGYYFGRNLIGITVMH